MDGTKENTMTWNTTENSMTSTDSKGIGWEILNKGQEHWLYMTDHNGTIRVARFPTSYQAMKVANGELQAYKAAL